MNILILSRQVNWAVTNHNKVQDPQIHLQTTN